MEHSQVRFACEDKWIVRGDELRLSRTVKVYGNSTGGFLSAITLPLDTSLSWPQVEWFAPGMIYGGFDHLTAATIGGKAFYRPGDFSVRVREDRLPAPLFAARFHDGHSLAVLDPAPRGGTTAADSLDVQVVPMTDERFQFGAIGTRREGGEARHRVLVSGNRGRGDLPGRHLPRGPAS